MRTADWESWETEHSQLLLLKLKLALLLRLVRKRMTGCRTSVDMNFPIVVAIQGMVSAKTLHMVIASISVSIAMLAERL